MPKPQRPRRDTLGSDLGPLLREVWRRSGCTADHLAIGAVVERSHLFKIFNGDRMPSFAIVEAICLACGVHVADLYSPALTVQEVPKGPRPTPNGADVVKKKQNRKSE